MSKKAVTILALVSFCCGGIFVLLHLDVIVIRRPTWYRAVSEECTTSVKQSVPIYYWNGAQCISEHMTSALQAEKSKRVRSIISLWLEMMHNEQLVERKVELEAVLLSQEGNALYISFSRTLFARDLSTYDKWYYIESLFKTLRESVSDITEVFFLVHHHPMKDSHLDFSQGWPINGFES